MANTTQTLNAKDMEEHNLRLLVPGKVHDGSVGFELEIWPFRKTADNPAALVRLTDEHGTGSVQLLQRMEDRIPGLRYAPTPSGLPRFEISKGGQITFEPGGQIEYSGPPMDTLAEAITDFTTVIEQLRCNLKPYGIWFFHSGLNPWHTLDEIGLNLTADRYQNMDRYLKAKSGYGQRMMRQSTSLQLNVDTGEAHVAPRRWLAANLLAPVFTALFGNSPFVDGKATGAYSYRSILWQNLDPSRTGFPKGMLSPEYCACPVEQYADFGMDAHVMMLPDGKGPGRFDGTLLTFAQWMKQGHNGLFPDMDDWKNHLSTLFPEVRVRGFLELRFLDAQSKVWCAVPAILLTHLIYDEEAREQVIEWMMPYRTTLPGMLETAARKGMDESEIADVAIRIFRLALDRLAKAEATKVAQLCEQFFRLYTHGGRNPAAELVRLNDGKVFTPSQYRDFEAAQVDQAGDLLQIICDYQ